MRVEQITHIAVHLPQIKSLGRANAETLGFLPDGAFDHYASRDWILVALDDLEVCIGYLLYRVSSRRANIVHLCVSDTASWATVVEPTPGGMPRRIPLAPTLTNDALPVFGPSRPAACWRRVDAAAERIHSTSGVRPALGPPTRQDYNR